MSSCRVGPHPPSPQARIGPGRVGPPFPQTVPPPPPPPPPPPSRAPAHCAPLPLPLPPLPLPLDNSAGSYVRSDTNGCQQCFYRALTCSQGKVPESPFCVLSYLSLSRESFLRPQLSVFVGFGSAKDFTFESAAIVAFFARRQSRAFPVCSFQRQELNCQKG